MMKLLNASLDDVVVFGDGHNDKEMLTLVKHGIAMGNAIEELKKVASEVTDTVDNDGIAKAFEKHFDIK